MKRLSPAQNLRQCRQLIGMGLRMLPVVAKETTTKEFHLCRAKVFGDCLAKLDELAALNVEPVLERHLTRLVLTNLELKLTVFGLKSGNVDLQRRRRLTKACSYIRAGLDGFRHNGFPSVKQ
jgi:hypothetical protein